MKTKKQKDPLRLMRWADENFPPIDLATESIAVLELIKEIRSLRATVAEKDTQITERHHTHIRAEIHILRARAKALRQYVLNTAFNLEASVIEKQIDILQKQLNPKG